MANPLENDFDAAVVSCCDICYDSAIPFDKSHQARWHHASIFCVILKFWA